MMITFLRYSGVYKVLYYMVTLFIFNKYFGEKHIETI